MNGDCVLCQEMQETCQHFFLVVDIKEGFGKIWWVEL